MVRGRCGFTMPELLISMSILIFLMTAVFSVLSTSQTAYNNADAGIQLRTIFRNVGQRMSWELSHTGVDAASGAQFVITPGAGANASDIVRFSVPVACDATTPFLNSSGNPSRWGAYLTWGCETVACADLDGDCGTVEYKYVQYELNSDGEIVRRVLDSSGTTVASQVMARSITGLTFSSNASGGIDFSITGQMRSNSGLMITDGISQTVRLMN
ncbi:MAG: type II secretion system protein [Candidatus Omnitrophota bacterium]